MDLEGVNCKLRLSECSDIEAMSSIERPLKVDREITGLETLIEELHRIFSNEHVNVYDVQKLMAGYKSDPKHWRKYAKFDRFRYTRNLVDAGNGMFNIMILCWGPGHASAIHDHADSHCFMKVLSGNLEEVRYEWPDHVQPEVLKKKTKDGGFRASDTCTDSCQNEENGADRIGYDDYESEKWREQEKMVESGRTRLEVDDVCYINDSLGLHRMENPSHVDGTVSLHLYCPPFDACRVFDARTGRASEVKVTFWSKYGKRVKLIENKFINDSQ